MCCCKALILNILNSEDVPTRALEMHASVCDHLHLLQIRDPRTGTTSVLVLPDCG